MLEAWLISPSQSPFLFTYFATCQEKRQFMRICVDYRSLNKTPIKDKFPIPNVDKLLDELQGSILFCKLDLKFVYIRSLYLHKI